MTRINHYTSSTRKACQQQDKLLHLGSRVEHDEVRCTPNMNFIATHSGDADIVSSVVCIFHEHKETVYDATMLHALVILFALLSAILFFCQVCCHHAACFGFSLSESELDLID